MKNIITASIICASLFGCQSQQSSDSIQREQQERILSEATAQTGMPAIKNFRERKLLKDILELRDQDGLTTFTYLVSEQTGEVGQLVCNSIGYGIPAATQYTSPEKDIFYTSSSTKHMSMPQADPNGLFSPSSAEGTWVMCLDEKQSKAVPVYIEPRIIVSPFELR